MLMINDLGGQMEKGIYLIEVDEHGWDFKEDRFHWRPKVFAKPLWVACWKRDGLSLCRFEIQDHAVCYRPFASLQDEVEGMIDLLRISRFLSLNHFKNFTRKLLPESKLGGPPAMLHMVHLNGYAEIVLEPATGRMWSLTWKRPGHVTIRWMESFGTTPTDGDKYRIRMFVEAKNYKFGVLAWNGGDDR